MTNELSIHNGNSGIQQATLSVSDVIAQVSLIQTVMEKVMKDGEHYGVIPGCGNKPALLKAGAEKLCLTFRLDPQYEAIQERDGAHLTVTSKCTLYHIPTGQRMGSGMGSCSTRESKYAYRKAGKKCPNPKCQKETIIKGKDEYGGGWICFKKNGGCGAKYQDGDAAIESQQTGRVPNEDLADQYNTVLKMANKRSLVAAVLNATAASDIFTQDIEEFADAEVKTPPTAPPSKPKIQPPKAKAPEPKKVIEGEFLPVPGSIPEAMAEQALQETMENEVMGIDPAERDQEETLNPDGSVNAFVRVVKVITDSGKGPNGPWTKYGIVAQHAGTERILGTFSATHGNLAEELKGREAYVRFRPKTLKNGKEVYDLEAIEAKKEAGAA